MFTASLTYVVIVVPVSYLGLGLQCSSLYYVLEENSIKLFSSCRHGNLLAMAYAWEFTLDPVIGVINKFLDDGFSVGWFYKLFTGSWWGSIQRKVGMEDSVMIECLIGWVTKSMRWVLFHL
ncbi:MAG: hypothetical protein Ct9H300mP28_35100 [Pseudomonadota bacterium]|nr:MAG: hypothetical protein Ct9H300mP28_35100 [Pseudomonadota bacterium]